MNYAHQGTKGTHFVHFNKGGYKMTANKKLIEERDISSEVKEMIDFFHINRDNIFKLMRKIDDRAILRQLDCLLDQLEATLQTLWGFPVDDRYYMFWLRPKCECPIMDNNERYPTGYYVINGGCPIHGE